MMKYFKWSLAHTSTIKTGIQLLNLKFWIGYQTLIHINKFQTSFLYPKFFYDVLYQNVAQLKNAVKFLEFFERKET